MPSSSSDRVTQPGSDLESAAVVVDAVVVDEAEPPTNQLILMGRAALADTEHNPDDWVDAETEEMLREAIPQNTLNLMAWAFGGAIWWCGKTGRQHMPMTPATMRQWIKEHWSMTRADGRLRGRRGQPYSPRTVETRVYLMSKIHKLKGFPSPVAHPKVQLQLRAYNRRYEKAGYAADQAYALSHDESVQVARACNLTVVGGLRNAAAFRVQFDTGMRASELLALNFDDVTWELPDDAGPGYAGPLNAVLHIRKSKTDQDAAGRRVGVEAVPDVDGDVDPAVLLSRYIDARRAAGVTTGPLWVEVTPGGPARQDGTLAGRFLDKAWTYDGYERAFMRAAKRAGVDRDPKTGELRRITSHSNRAGHVTAALDSGEPVEKVAIRTGHSPTGSIHGYYRLRRRFGASNTGTRIRAARRRPAG